MHTTDIYAYKNFSTMPCKGLRENIEKRRDGEIGNIN